jgi:toxin ParE1/3/4
MTQKKKRENMLQPVRSPEAELDAALIWRYIAEHNLPAAERWLATIDEKIRLLCEFPGAGRRRDDLAPRIRSYPVGQYLIFYRTTETSMEIVRILHGARKLQRVFTHE